MILTVGNTKGGVGKTTLAVNLAIVRSLAGKDVLLIDGDDQGSAATFTDLRSQQLGEAGYTAVQLQGEALRDQVKRLRSKYSEIIIDVGGRNTDSLRAALVVSDVVLIPIQPSTYDVWAVEQIAHLVTEAQGFNTKLRAVAVLNAADAQGSDNDEAREALADLKGIEMASTAIVRRKAFRNAAAQGRSVVEMSPRDPKAVDELNTIVSMVFRV